MKIFSPQSLFQWKRQIRPISLKLWPVLPIIQVQSNDDLTTALIRFSLNTFQTDIVNLANGSASEEIITSYTSDILNYIADDQGIDSNEIHPI